MDALAKPNKGFSVDTSGPVPRLLWDGQPTVQLAFCQRPEGAGKNKWVTDAPGEVSNVRTQGLTWEGWTIVDGPRRAVALDPCGTNPRHGDVWSVTHTFLRSDLSVWMKTT